jgi:hypothetical protein
MLTPQKHFSCDVEQDEKEEEEEVGALEKNKKIVLVCFPAAIHNLILI